MLDNIFACVYASASNFPTCRIYQLETFLSINQFAIDKVRAWIIISNFNEWKIQKVPRKLMAQLVLLFTKYE